MANVNIKVLIKNSYIIQKQIEELNKTLASNKAKMQQYFDENKLSLIEVERHDSEESKGIIIVAKKEEKCYIEYDVDAMKENFEKELFDSIVFKEYIVEDIDAMVKLLREAGAKPKDFKKLIRAVVTPNKAALKQAFSLGEITKEDLKGCYTANITKSIKIKEKK